MGNKMIKLEAEIKKIKSDKNESMVKKDEETEDKTQVQNKPDQDVKDPTIAEYKKEIVNESGRDIPTLVQSSLNFKFVVLVLRKKSH